MFILTRCLDISSRFVYYVHYTTLYCDVLFSTCRYIPCDRLSKNFFSFQTCTYGHCDLLSCEIKPSSTFLLLSASFYLSVNSMKWSSIAVSKWYNTYMYLPHVTLLVESQCRFPLHGVKQKCFIISILTWHSTTTTCRCGHMHDIEKAFTLQATLMALEFETVFPFWKISIDNLINAAVKAMQLLLTVSF